MNNSKLMLAIINCIVNNMQIADFPHIVQAYTIYIVISHGSNSRESCACDTIV